MPSKDKSDKTDISTGNIDPDSCAARAEETHTELAKLGRQQLSLVLRAGDLLLAAKNQLGHGKFEASVKRWQDEGLITFSSRSARRWMRIARHSAVLKSASVADLDEAEKYIKALEATGDEKLPEDNVQATSRLTKDVAIAEIDNHIVKNLRKIPQEECAEFLRGIVAIAKSRLESLDA